MLAPTSPNDTAECNKTYTSKRRGRVAAPPAVLLSPAQGRRLDSLALYIMRHLDKTFSLCRRKHPMMQTRQIAALTILVSLVLITAGWAPPTQPPQTSSDDRPPNIVIISADDLGYGDLGSYGHPTVRTPNLDRMATEGQRWTSFYAQAPVCSPSRAALLTGRLHLRSGMFGRETGVFFPDSLAGLPPTEVTVAEALRELGYATGIIGKWHLGHRPEYLPTRHGFDSWFGIPYSNDMDWNLPPGLANRTAYFNPQVDYWRVPLMRDEEEIERPADQHTVTRRYAEEAVAFIELHQHEPFFLYLPHTMPHMPLFRSGVFEGRSSAGVYGDVIEEIDWAVGEVIEVLDRLNLSTRTLVVFTSDNGPWTSFETHGGSAGPLRHGKGTTFEGGMRVPGIFWWPKGIQHGVIHGMGVNVDLITIIGQCYFAANRCRGLLLPSVICPKRTVHVVKARNKSLHPAFGPIFLAEHLGEQFFPTVAAFGHGRVSV